eukprot:g2722.t1
MASSSSLNLQVQASGSSLNVGGNNVASNGEASEKNGIDNAFLSKYVQKRDDDANHVELADDDEALPSDGGSDADSDEANVLNVERKLCLFQTPTIQRTLLKFWRTLLNSADRGENENTVGMDTFIEFNILLQRVLLQEELDLSAARASAVTDWIESTTLVPDNATMTDDSSFLSSDDPRPIGERRMTLDQFALFLFDLAVIWCHLSYSSFLFFLGVIFLHTTSADGIKTKTFKLRNIAKVQPLPDRFFEMAADEFEFEVTNAAASPGKNKSSAGADIASSFNTSQASRFGTSTGGFSTERGRHDSMPARPPNLQEGGSSSSTAHGAGAGAAAGGNSNSMSDQPLPLGAKSPLKTPKKSSMAAHPQLPTSLASSRAMSEYHRHSTDGVAGGGSQDQHLHSGAGGVGAVAQEQHSHSTSKADVEDGDDSTDEGKRFENWYRLNFETEAETLLFVQRQMFEVTRDMRAVFLFPAAKVSNRTRILELLDAAKRLQMDLEKVAPVKPNALLSTVGRKERKGSLSPLRVATEASTDRAPPAHSRRRGPHGRGAPSGLSSPAKQSFGGNAGGAPASGGAHSLPKSLRPRAAGGEHASHPFYQTQTAAAGMFFSQAKRKPDKYLVVGKVEEFRAHSRGRPRRTMLVETSGGWRSGFSTVRDEMPLGVAQRFGAPQFHRFPNEDELQEWSGRAASRSPPRSSSRSPGKRGADGTSGRSPPKRDPPGASSLDRLPAISQSPPKRGPGEGGAGEGSSKEFIARFENYLEEQGDAEEPLPAYDLPIRIPELKPWLATQATDILYWVKGQEEMVLEKTRKFQSIQGLPGPLSNSQAQVWLRLTKTHL